MNLLFIESTMIRSAYCRLLPRRVTRFYYSTVPQLHPLLQQRAKDLQQEHKALESKLEAYDADLQIKFDTITSILDKVNKLTALQEEISELEAITSNKEEDPELTQEATEELEKLIPQANKLISKLQNQLLPPVKYSDKKCILELRPGVGGAEAGIFTRDLLNMYINFSNVNKWPYKIISETKTSGGGGIVEAILAIDYPGAYNILRHESGVHRVQRIPQTETKGRIHTSTAAVVVLPKLSEGNANSLKEDERSFAPGEVRIDTMRAGGKGGQHVNTTDSAVRLVHIPTGLIVIQQDERSQPQNKAKAFAILRARLAEKERIDEVEKQKSLRTEQVSTTDRSDKIRTYNYPQHRVTDHRCGYSLHDLDGCMNGEKLLELIEKVEDWEFGNRLAEMIAKEK
ncbi:MRF1 [[Candida] subhashii]|uniref:Peptide chain release factor 1, mitochondrial n=1 Tax=[Candida] subhashii TaxID=561895 RepID=A0A8J5V5F7_9ASCO|nr:MRF1 [[Candida] subhashii]KAG7665989.1 MRF1 [[Candida] subhashii]